MARAVASMSDRIDDLTAVADKQIKVAIGFAEMKARKMMQQR